MTGLQCGGGCDGIAVKLLLRKDKTREILIKEVISSAFKWLLEQIRDEGKWKARHITALRDTDKETSEGLVFGHCGRLRIFAKHGYLTLMDATRSTHEMKWLLYTLMIRQMHGKWIPGAHLLTAKADGNSIV